MIPNDLFFTFTLKKIQLKKKEAKIACPNISFIDDSLHFCPFVFICTNYYISYGTPPALWVWMQIISRNTQLLHYGIHVFTGGLETETDYKYRGHNEKCSMDKSKIRVKINDSVSISSNETGLYRFKSCVKLWMFVFDLHRFYYEINNQNMYLYMEVNNNEYLQIVTPIIYSIYYWWYILSTVNGCSVIP